MAEPGDLLHVHALTLMGRALSFLSWRGTRSHTGVHQGRKSLRRVRSCLSLAFAGRTGRWCALDAAIARISRGLSMLRDVHARVQIIDRLLALAATDELRTDLQRLRSLALAERIATMKKAQHDDPLFERRRRELRQLVHALDALAWHRVDNASLRRSMALALQRCDKAKRQALAGGDSEDWHRWRRRRRQLVQQCAVLTECAIDLDDLPPAQRKLAHLLGEAQDLSILFDYVDANTALPKPQRSRLASLLRAARKASHHAIRRRSVTTRAKPARSSAEDTS